MRTFIRLALVVLLIAAHVPANADCVGEDVDAVIVLDENEFIVKGKNKATYRRHRIVKINTEAEENMDRWRLAKIDTSNVPISLEKFWMQRAI